MAEQRAGEPRTVVVTGAGRGLGLEYARLFARDGDRVALVDIDEEAAEKAAADLRASGATALGFGGDVSDEAAATAVAGRIAQEWQRLDVLVNNAAIWGDLEPAPVTEVDPEYWDRVMAVNVKGALLCARAVLPTMREQGRGRIVNISSMGAYMAGGVYNTSKMALNQLTLNLASEAGEGITVNAVAPGLVLNEATRRQVPQPAIDGLVQRCIVKRPGHPEDVYAAIRFLASDEAGYITAQTLLVNGGYSTRL